MHRQTMGRLCRQTLDEARHSARGVCKSRVLFVVVMCSHYVYLNDVKSKIVGRTNVIVKHSEKQ